ncbi:MAG: hypothetical protein V4481_05080 [Patescibacteria group bacterium]
MPEPTIITAPVAKAPTKQKKTEVKSPQKFVTVDQFNKLAEAITKIGEAVVEMKSKPAPTVAETEEVKNVKKAGPDNAPIPPSWEEKAQEILGEVLDHCELYQPPAGGTHFTVVIKAEFSNAPKEYLERMKVDRRTKEIGSGGISAVEVWCKLIKQNLKKR